MRRTTFASIWGFLVSCIERIDEDRLEKEYWNIQMTAFSQDKNFPTALAFTLSWKQKPSQEVYDLYRNYRKVLPRSLSLITTTEIEDLYYNLYWYPISADLMCLPLAVAAFDTAAEFGVRTALLILQKTLEASNTDGLFSTEIVELIRLKNTLTTAKAYLKNRINYRFERVQRKSEEFKNLKLNIKRDIDLLAYAIEHSIDCVEVAPPVDIKQLRQHINSATLELNKITQLILSSGQNEIKTIS